MRRIRGGEDHARWHRRVLLAVLLSVLMGACAGIAASTRTSGYDSARVLLAVDRFERLVAELETGKLRYVVTGDREALAPWKKARADLHRQATLLERLAAEVSPDQGRRAREIVRAATAYLHEHAEPLVRVARRDHTGARAAVTRADGKRRIDAIHRQVDRFMDVQHRFALAHERGALPALRRVIAIAAGASGSLLLFFLLFGYVQRSRDRTTVRGDDGPDADEALRLLATRVASNVPLPEVFSTAARAMGRTLGADHALVCRYERDGTVTVAGHWSVAGSAAPMPPAGGRWPVEDEAVTDLVERTGRPAHLRTDLPATGPIGAWLRSNGIQRLTGCPIVAGDRLWGMAAVLSRTPGSWPPEPLADFAALLGLAVAHTRHRGELAASRVRLIEASDAVRHRVERRLHESTQQRLVSVGLELRTAQANVPASLAPLRQQLTFAADQITAIIDDLQDMARTLHPAYLPRRGLGPSLRALGRRAGVPVEFRALGDERRLPDNVAVTVYFVVAESLTNAARHARASLVRVTLDLGEPVRLSVHDDGVGGARLRPGAALAALKDRVEALGGTFSLQSSSGAGTTVRVTLPTVPP